jgi:hypothetical protein
MGGIALLTAVCTGKGHLDETLCYKWHHAWQMHRSNMVIGCAAPRPQTPTPTICHQSNGQRQMQFVGLQEVLFIQSLRSGATFSPEPNMSQSGKSWVYIGRWSSMPTSHCESGLLIVLTLG